jgi:hypothetical protein
MLINRNKYISIIFPRDVIKSKSKSVPLSHEGTKGGRMCSSYSFFTSALHGGEWLESHSGCALPPGKDIG